MSESLDFLGLPGIKATAKRQTDVGLEVEAESIDPIFPTICCLDQKIAPDGARPNRRIINDTPHGGLPTVLLIKVRRAKCRSCGRKGMIESLPGLHHTRFMTQRLHEQIARETLLRPNTRMGFEVGVTEGTARAVLKEFIDEKLADREIVVPRVLGIDEKKLLGDYRCILGNIEQRTVLDLLPNRDHALRAYLEAMPNKEKVEVVAADMYAAYYRFQREYFPHASHVYDRFHVTRRANHALDAIRTAVANAADPLDRKYLRGSKRLFIMRAKEMDDRARARISRWSLQFPILGQAYWTKERYFEMYELCHTPAEAEWYYKNWVKTLPIELRQVFLKHCTITKDQSGPTFAYFDHPFTTGYVEAMNRVLDDIQRVGRGYSFEIIRGKIMLAPKLQKRTFRDRQPGLYLPEEERLPPIVFDYGMSLDELSSLLNDGWLHYDDDGKAWIRSGETTIRALGPETI